MKVLFLSHYPLLYGANRSLLNLIKELIKLGVDPYVITTEKGDFTDELERNEIKYTIFNLSWGFVNKEEYTGIRGLKNRLKLFQDDYRSAKKLASIVGGQEFDLIYSNSSVISTGFYLARELKLPHFWHIREFADLHYNLIPVVGLKLFKVLLSHSSAVILVSECLKTHYSIGNSKTHVVYNGIATQDKFLEYRSITEGSIKRQDGKFIFCIVGLITPDKGQINAIKAIELLNNKYKNLKLIVAGEGESKYVSESIYGYIDENKINNIEFLGHVKDPFSVFQSSNVTLMCSKNEAMGRVTVESMCVGTPVIGLNSGGTKELIQHNRTGLLYDGTVQDLALQMERLILDAKLRENLAMSGWDWAYKNCTQEKYGQTIHQVMLDVYENKLAN